MKPTEGNQPCASTKLRFRCIDVSARSALSAELAPGERKGIYRYEFTDGTWYVGKSVDMVERYAQHLHEYRHRPDFEGVGIAAAYFASVDAACSDEELDRLETAAIADAEAEGRDLRNLLKVGRPGGNTGLLLDMDGHGMRSLPWDRAERTSALPAAELGEPTASQRERFKKLCRLPEGKALLDVLALYAETALQEPANTAGLYWTATTYPARKRTPAACVTCGTLETLAVFADGGTPYGYVNVKRPDGDGGLPPVTPWRLYDYGYKAAGGVRTCEFSSIDELRRLLARPRFADWAYRLTIECFRRCKNPMAAKGNPLLMEAMATR